MVCYYLGIGEYHVLPDPLVYYIEHIDCWEREGLSTGERIDITESRIDIFNLLSSGIGI
jgi:hypothetical protein